MAEKLERPVSPELESILGQPLKVLDDGFVRVVDYMGNDSSIVQAARVSYGKGTKQVHEDRGLIRYLLRHWHSTPFEMCEIKLHVRVPMDTWRQWIRHRMANVNEYSTRYSEAIDSAQKTDPAEWRTQSGGNRQGSDGFLELDLGKKMTEAETELLQLARATYEERLKQGVAREQARKDLPLSTYTEAYWKMDLHNLLHFLRLRMDDHAQWEIREYAKTIGEQIVQKWVPFVWEAFQDYRFESVSLTKLDRAILREIQTGSKDSVLAKAISFGWLDESGKPSKKNRERLEFEEKLLDLGFSIPWAQ